MPILQRIKDAYRAWIPIRRNMPRAERFGIGSKIDASFLELLETIRKAAYANLNNKIILLEEAITIIDTLRFFFQLSWEAELIHTNQYSLLGKEIEGIGKMAGGWKKDLIVKNSASGGERN